MPAGPPRACPVTVAWDPSFLAYDFGPEHPFTEASRAAAVDLLAASGFFDRPHVDRAEGFDPAPPERLELFHRRSYLRFVRSASAGGGTGLLDRGDTPSFPACYEVAARIVEGTFVARERVWDRPGTHGYAPAGGLHHAHPDRASGFCIFNDVAVAISASLAAGGRVAYVDIDAHHGDGVMYGFYRDGRLLDIDVHQDGRTLFPGTGAVGEVGEGDGAGAKVNLPLPPGAGDREFAVLFDRLVVPLVREHRPHLIVLQSGVDGHAGDPLARLRYTARSYRRAYRGLHELAHELCGGRILVTGGGGYHPGNVSRILATAAHALAGSEDAIPERGALPEGWRRGYLGRFGREAPTTWGGAAGPAEDSPRSEVADRLVEEVGRHLGRRFPA